MLSMFFFFGICFVDFFGRKKMLVEKKLVELFVEQKYGVFCLDRRPCKCPPEDARNVDFWRFWKFWKMIKNSENRIFQHPQKIEFPRLFSMCFRTLGASRAFECTSPRWETVLLDDVRHWNHHIVFVCIYCPPMDLVYLTRVIQVCVQFMELHTNVISNKRHIQPSSGACYRYKGVMDPSPPYMVIPMPNIIKNIVQE